MSRPLEVTRMDRKKAGTGATRELSATELESVSGGAGDRRKASLDNIQKFLDIVRSMNPQI